MREEVNYNQLLVRAEEIIEYSYSPYSNYSVAAVALNDNGEMYGGVNVENASFGMSMCAERVAMYNAIADGNMDIIAVAIYHDGESMPYPCGACLQVMGEFNDSMQVIIANVTGQQEVFTLAQLLPLGFKPDELKKY